MDEGFDINAEYEKLHGPVSRKMLFDEEEYELLRQQIIESPRSKLNSGLKYKLMPLPFTGIKLLTEVQSSEESACNEELSLANIISSLHTPFKNIFSLLQSKDEKDSNHHFFLSNLPHYQASGYFCKEDALFYICKGSIVSGDGEMSTRRQHFLDKACQKVGNSWTVIKNAKCKTASGAAYYVTGQLNADYTLWRDENGRYLKDFFPKLFWLGGNSTSQDIAPTALKINDSVSELKSKIRWGAHPFYLRTAVGERDMYDAKGYYDPKTGQFTIKGGSLLSSTVKSLKFDQSYIGRLRASIINAGCSKEMTGYRLKSDMLFKDPIYAASIVMGKTVNGWNLWKDSKDIYLSTYTS